MPASSSPITSRWTSSRRPMTCSGGRRIPGPSKWCSPADGRRLPAGRGAPAGRTRRRELSMRSVPAVRTEGLSKQYGPVTALGDLDLEIPPGEVFGYLGPNGAGKTTTVRLLLGLIRPSAGRAEIFGVDCQRQTVEAHRYLSYVPGEASLWPALTGLETLHLLARTHGRSDPTYRDELIDRFDFDPSKRVRAYSK